MHNCTYGYVDQGRHYESYVVMYGNKVGWVFVCAWGKVLVSEVCIVYYITLNNNVIQNLVSWSL